MSYSMKEFFFERLLSHDNELLERRAQEAADTLSTVPCVRMVILCGSVAKKRTTPFSDIDFIITYDSNLYKSAQKEIEEGYSPIRHCLIEAGFVLGGRKGCIDMFLEIPHEVYIDFIENGVELHWLTKTRRLIKESKHWKVLLIK